MLRMLACPRWIALESNRTRSSAEVAANSMECCTTRAKSRPSVPARQEANIEGELIERKRGREK